MEGVTIVAHPLVQHKLTLMREKERSTKSFRELISEIGALLCYEVTRDLPLADVEIETPLARMTAPQLSGKKLVKRRPAGGVYSCAKPAGGERIAGHADTPNPDCCIVASRRCGNSGCANLHIPRAAQERSRHSIF